MALCLTPSETRYGIDDLFSVNNEEFGSYLSTIYPSELEPKDTYINNWSVLPRRKEGKLGDNKSPSHVSIYDKRDDFAFRIVNFQHVEDSTEHPHQTRLRVVPHFSSGIV